jgi:hypothetical protein
LQDRLETLFDDLVDAAATRDLGIVLGNAQQLAAERYGAGYDLLEVQTAINALEEATWRRILSGHAA